MIADKKTVLVVEDDTALRNVLKDKLEGAGFSVLSAKDGEEGFKIAVKKKPDLILLDVIMPKLDGLAMLKKLRGGSWGKTVPVLLLSNDTDPEHISDTLKNNASDYLIKSDWKLDDVIKRIKENTK